MEDDSGQRFLYWVLEADASVAKVVAAPKSFIGRRCVILYDMVEEVLVGDREPTDLTRVRLVRWGDAPGGVNASNMGTTGPSRDAPGSGDLDMESVIRSFFAAVQNHDLAGVTELLEDPVQYYQTRPISRSAALADIKSDWRKYSDWKGEVSRFQAKDAFSCGFELSYTTMEGHRPRAATLWCEASLSRNPPHRIKSISAKVIKKTQPEADSGYRAVPDAVGFSEVRRFRFVRPANDAEIGAVFDLELSTTANKVRGVWTSTWSDGDERTRRQSVGFSGEISGSGKSGEKKVFVSFPKNDPPYMFPANKKPVWLIRESDASGTIIRVPAYLVFGRNSEEVIYEFHEVFE
jgi:hypothetical protein